MNKGQHNPLVFFHEIRISSLYLFKDPSLGRPFKFLDELHLNLSKEQQITKVFLDCIVCSCIYIHNDTYNNSLLAEIKKII